MYQSQSVFMVMSASGEPLLVPDQVTARVLRPLRFIQATSFSPSNVCGPGVSRTSEGRRLVVPGLFETAKLEMGYVHVPRL